MPALVQRLDYIPMMLTHGRLPVRNTRAYLRISKSNYRYIRLLLDPLKTICHLTYLNNRQQ